MSRAQTSLVAALLPLILGIVVYVLVPDGAGGFAQTGTRLGLLVILVAAGFGATVRAYGRDAILYDGVMLLSGAGAASAIAFVGGLDVDAASRAAAVAGLAWGLPLAYSMPFRALGLVTTGRVTYLVAAAAMLGTPWLVPMEWNELPSWVLEWNPLSRLHGAVLEEDWFHGPVLYRRLGENLYRYPGWAECLALQLKLAVRAVALAAVFGLARADYVALRATQA
ncbi:MAG: hypothetical protein CMJ83_05745 [Planctomycetes bacterium]|nr:hypothetical protein [Planctomycetota bacterium]